MLLPMASLLFRQDLLKKRPFRYGIASTPLLGTSPCVESFWAHYSVPVICVSILLLIPHLGYSDGVISPKIRLSDSFHLVYFFRIVSAVEVPLACPFERAVTTYYQSAPKGGAELSFRSVYGCYFHTPTRTLTVIILFKSLPI